MAKAEHDMTALLNHDSDHLPYSRSLPPAGIKIDKAFRHLLISKNYSDITIEDIVQTSGVNSALIYKYYGDKRGLFYQVLNEGLNRFHLQLERDLKGIKGALNKLRKIVWAHINLYKEGRVTARIMLMEARSHHSFFTSAAYAKIRQYNALVRDIIEEGVREGVIRSDINPVLINQVLMGAIEHLCLPWLISGEDVSEDEITEALCNVIFGGIETPKSNGK